MRPGRRLQRMAFRIAAKILEQHEVALRRRQLGEAFRPELLEAGEGNALGGRARARLIVDPLAPGHLVAPFGEGGLVAEAPRERAENVEVVPRLADRVDGAMHGENERVARRAADVVALERGGGRQHDVGVARGRRPPAVMDDDRLRLLPRARQAVEVLVVMERIAARPIDQPYVGIGVLPAVERVARARIEQHVGDAGDRNDGARRIERQWQLGPRHVDARHADAVGGAVAEREAAAGEPDAAQHRRQHDRRPIGLLAMMRALQRPRAGDHAAGRGGAARKVADRVGGARR